MTDSPAKSPSNQKDSSTENRNPSFIAHQTWEGPIPPPQVLKLLDENWPGTAVKIIDQAVLQTQHRIELEREVITRQLDNADRGQKYGLLIGMTGVVGGIALVFAGHDAAGASIASICAGGLATTFIVGKVKQVSDMSKKRSASQRLMNDK